jgi:replication factor A1
LSCTLTVTDSYIISVAVADHTDQLWLQGFNDVGSIILGISANELIEMKVGDY